MAKKDIHAFWEKVNNYEKEIISVFAIESSLTKEITNVKNKNTLTVADFGCGSGNSFKYLKEFKKIYAVDFSSNMLNMAKEKSLKKFILIEEDISTVKLKEKVDLALAISSIVPENFDDFYKKIDNILQNTKKKGKIILTLSSFESRLLSFQLDADFMYRSGLNPQEIMFNIKRMETNENLNSLGYMFSHSGLVQKQWIKEEILFRLKKYNFSKVRIKKLTLDWEKQIKKKEYKKYPNLWMWLVIIEI